MVSTPPTVLFITHHVEQLSPRTLHVVLMKDGQIAASGPPEDVITATALTEAFGCVVTVRREHGRFWVTIPPNDSHTPA